MKIKIEIENVDDLVVQILTDDLDAIKRGEGTILSKALDAEYYKQLADAIEVVLTYYQPLENLILDESKS